MELGEVTRVWRGGFGAARIGAVFTVVIGLAAASVFWGCGSGGSNDQGLSFRVFGIFQEIEEKVPPEADKLPTVDEHPGDTGRVVSFSNAATIPNDQNGDGDLDGGFIGLENRMTTQRLNIVGVNVDIEIPGATIPLRSDFVTLALTLDRRVSEEEDPGLGNVALAQVTFVSRDVMTFLANNRSGLPPTPFDMIVVMTAEAVGDTGDRFVSNEFTYRVTFVD